MKVKVIESDGQTTNEKYRVTALTTLQNIIIKNYLITSLSS